MEHPMVCFTFDDGVTLNTDLTLDLLEYENIIATFFIITKTLELPYRKNLLEKIDKKGHIVGNHTVNHCDITTLEDERLIFEIQKANNDIESIINKPVKYFRPPAHKSNFLIDKKIKNMGLKVVYSNVYARDWDLNMTKENMLTIYKNYFEKPKNIKYIINMHDRITNSILLIPEIANIVRKSGCEIVSLDKIFES